MPHLRVNRFRVSAPGRQLSSVMPAPFAAPRSKVMVFSHPADVAETAIHSYRRSFAKLPGLAPGDLDLAAVIELNVQPAAHT